MMTDPGLAGCFVDEYQDTNRLQAAVLLALKPDGAGLTVVGDDAQSIYSFRAATVRNILDFPGRFSPPPEIVTLAQNYRSAQPILAAANAVIDLASERFTKNLWTERNGGDPPQLIAVGDEADQARYVVERVLESREAGVKLKQQAVLFRASHHSSPLEIELTRRNIPFVKFGGLKFLEAAHVKDLLAVLRFVAFGRAAVRLSQTRLRSTAKGETLPVASAAPTTKEAMPVANLLDAGGRLRSSVVGRLTLCSFQAPSQTSACSGRWVEHTHHFSRLAAFSREGAADAARTRTSSSSSRADTAFHK
jgi:DNA helicase II / ATP-dependent DNA helicase PcrA